MAVTIVSTDKKAKVAGKAIKPVAVKSEADQRAERIIAVQVDLIEAKKITADYEKDRKFLASLADETAKPEDEVVYTVEGGSVKFSPKTEQTAVTDIKAIHQTLGDEAFYAIAKISIDNLKKYLSASEIEKVAASKLTGARRISVVVDNVAEKA